MTDTTPIPDQIEYLEDIINPCLSADLSENMNEFEDIKPCLKLKVVPPKPKKILPKCLVPINNYAPVYIYIIE